MKKINMSQEPALRLPGELRKKSREADRDRVQTIVDKSYALADAIRSCSEYRDYIRARERLYDDEMNSKVLQELREQQLSLQFGSVDEDFDRKARFLNEMYMAVSLNPVISDYLNAEYRFDLVMDEIRKALGDLFVFEDENYSELPGKNEYPN